MKSATMIAIENLNICFPEFAIRDIHLSVKKGEFFTLLGPTGAGKSLILEAIAGLAPITSGSLFLKGEEITHLPPEKRHLSIVYQDGALFPHLTVYENIAFGLKYLKEKPAHLPKPQDLMKRLGILHLASRKPKGLSGGEKQRTALARALAVAPDLLLLDEPLSALDPATRKDIGTLLKTLHTEMGMTCLMVTHDFAEARALGTCCAIIHQGKIHQQGSIDKLMANPKTQFVSRFLMI